MLAVSFIRLWPFTAMPELPEVTTIVRDLNRRARGKQIADVWTDTPKLVRPLTAAAFHRQVVGRVFLRFERRGKFILACLGPPRRRVSRSQFFVTCYLVWHMRMTGHPLFRDEKRETARERATYADPRNQHIRLSFRFTDGTRLDYSDVRKFGTLHVAPSAVPDAHPALTTLGPDAWDHRWTAAELRERLRGRRTTVKQALLNQTLIAGIGNIYADEILWTAGIHPRLRTERLTRSHGERLRRAIRQILSQAIRARGTSVDDFRDLRGRKGAYEERLRVYQRTGKPCFRCREEIGRIVVGGRGTHVCPQCQRAPRQRRRTHASR